MGDGVTNEEVDFRVNDLQKQTLQIVARISEAADKVTEDAELEKFKSIQ